MIHGIGIAFAVWTGWLGCGWGSGDPVAPAPAPEPDPDGIEAPDDRRARRRGPRRPGGGTDRDPEPGGWRLVEVRDGERRMAVCNDGDPASFLVRPGAPGERRWIVFLEGGGRCVTVDECRGRAPMRRRPPRSAAGGPERGILSPDPARNPDFHDWNAVFLPYCSSDFWIGDAPASAANGGFAFRGARIVDAVIADLKAGVEGMPPLDRATDLLFAGGSAGSMGVRHHVDQAAGSLPRTRVLGLADSGFEPFGDAGLPPDGTTGEQLALWKPRPDASCVAAAGVERCLDPTFVLQHLDTPLFVFQDQFDANTFGRAKIPDRECGDARRFAAAVRQGLTRFPAAFSTRAGIHVLSIKDNFTDLKVADPGSKRAFSMAEVLGAWVLDRSGPPRRVIAGD